MAFPANIDLSSLDGTTGFRLSGEAAGDRSGRSVASAGDVNGDGFADLIVGADGADPNGGGSGASYVVFGKASGFASNIDLSSLDGLAGFRLAGAAADSYSGKSVASAGDVNGDGFADLIVGAWLADPNGLTNSGASYVVFGKASGFASNIDLSSLDGSTGFTLSGAAAGDVSGFSVGSAGDVNGDGLADLIIGARSAGGTGASYVIYGKQGGYAANLDLSSLDGSTGFKLSGVSASDRAGMSVASAGDVNGDGFADLIIGADGADPNGDGSGASYVVFGKASGFASNLDLSSLNGTTGFKLSGVADFDSAGFSVASAGDINGDGFADLIVGAYRASPYTFFAGASYVVFGKASGFASNLDLSSLDGTTGFRLLGGGDTDYSGYSVASAGDFNGDGFADVIVGARRADTSSQDTGASYVVLGKATGFASSLDLTSLDGSNGFKLSGVGFYDWSGTSVASASDVNGDGFADLIIGARAADPNGNLSGASYVVFGALDGSTTPVTTTGTVAVDTLIGAAGDDTLTGGGGADVFHGGAGDDLLTIGDLTFQLVDGGGDTDTLALGGSGLTLDLANRTLVARIDGIERIDLTGIGNNTLEADRLAVLEGIGAVTDGMHVLAVGGDAGDTVVFDRQWQRNGSFTDTHGTFTRYVSGNAEIDVEQGISVSFPSNIDLSSLDGSSGFTLNGAANEQSGTTVASAGDVNGDGFADVIVGAPPADTTGGTDAGASWVVFGKASGFASLDLSSLDGSTGFKLSGEAASDRGGRAASAGDVNGDGFADLITGAPYADANGADSGATYVVFGKATGLAANLDLSSLNGSNGFKLSGEAAGDRSGRSVASAGDVNGDGLADLIVGANQADANGSNSGASYVVFGKQSGFAATIDLGTLDGSNGFRLSGAAADDRAGSSVAGGDVNGDGYADVIVGALGADPNGSLSGASYVVFGKATGFAADIDLGSLDGTNGFEIAGAASPDRSGRSVATAGDINGDGFADLLIGAAQASPHGFYSGASYVVFGKASFAATPTLDLSSLDGTDGFKLSGVAANDETGYSVAAAGDVNGDGFADLIVGTSDASTDPGASYLVFGKATGFTANLDLSSLDGSNGFQLSGVAAGDGAGGSVASAGDVNDDGFADLIVGAGGAGNLNAGASYVVFGGAFGADSAPVTTTGTAAPEGLIGDSGDDTLTGGGGADWFHGGAGADLLTVGDTGFLLVDGGTGEDTLALGGSGQTLDLTDGTVAARIDGIERIDLTGSGNNTLMIDRLAVIDGPGAVGNGLHVLAVQGNAGDTVLFDEGKWHKTGSFTDAHGTFDRYVFGNAEVDVEQSITIPLVTINGTAGNDIISPNETVAGQPFATSRDDTINGFAGDDDLNGGPGADTMVGGADNDTYTVDDPDDAVTELLNEGTDTVRSALSYDLGAGSNVENLRLLGSTAIDGTGNELANVLTGNRGDNLLAGLGGADVLNGGQGIDTASYAASPSAVTVNLETGVGSGGDAQGDALTGIENLTGGAFDDTLVGNRAANVLTGLDGNDTLDGGVGTDSMFGGNGDDTYIVDNAGDFVKESLFGNQGTDTVQASVSFGLNTNVENLELTGTRKLSGTGNASNNTITGNDAPNILQGYDGDDRLIGGNGRDTLTGGTGGDGFVMNAPAEGLDIITDFTSGSDYFELLGSGFNDQLVAGATPTLITTGSNSAANSGAQPYFIYDNIGGHAGTLYFDATGGSGIDAVAIAILSGMPALAATDLHIV